MFSLASWSTKSERNGKWEENTCQFCVYINVLLLIAQLYINPGLASIVYEVKEEFVCLRYSEETKNTVSDTPLS